jgi:hypothetical protein
MKIRFSLFELSKQLLKIFLWLNYMINMIIRRESAFFNIIDLGLKSIDSY